jgi:YgiT-type zinc finger domain-containing protein
MRERIWKNCPCCGAKGTMQRQAERTERFNPAGYAPVEVSGLDGCFCSACGDGFWSLKSERSISATLAEHMARQDSQRIVAAELASVKEAADAMQITVQGVHKMMKEGRLRYVLAAGHRLPIRMYMTSAHSGVETVPLQSRSKIAGKRSAALRGR